MEDKKKTGVDKDISQRESAKQAEEELKNSLYFYKKIIEKFETDLTCYGCKKNIKDIEVEDKNNIMMVLPVRTCDKGMWVCVSICSKCQKEHIEKKENESEK